MKKTLLRFSLLSMLLTLCLGVNAETSEDVTATWDWQNGTPASITATNIQGTDATGTVASDVEGIQLNVLAAVAGTKIKLQYNASGYAQFNTNTMIQVPVKNKGDVVTVVSYPGQSKYTVGGEDATGQNTFTHTATSAEATQGYVEIIATATAYLYSIQVVQKAPSTEPVLVEKSIYKTDFSDWDTASPSDPATVMSKKTLFTNETLDFTLFQTSSMATKDSKFAAYTTLPKMCLRAEKDKGSVITTSALAEITKIRFIHGATGSNRGWKLEAKGEGDADWVVISGDAANPQNWCEVTKDVNKKNVQLRFTNLAANQNAFLFELEVFAKVDLSNSPMLGSFKANDKTYLGDDFEMNAKGDYEATFELFSTDNMISEGNPVTDVVADNGEIGTITYEGDANQCKVTIPVTAKGQTANYIATFVRKPICTLTYLNVSGQEMGTQQVEKDTKIGAFSYNIADVAATKEGYKARGWFKQNYAGEKYTTESVITEDATLYAVETEVEVSSLSRKYDFNLKDANFYAEDHEAFNPTGGQWHDTTHGWVFSNGNTIEVLVGPKATVSFTICKHSKEGSKIVCGATELPAQSETDGDVVAYNHDGEAGSLIFTINSTGSVYIHSVKIMNTAETNFTQDGQWFFVKPGDASSFVDALDYVNGLNANAAAERAYIFLPNGLYDLETKTLTQISGHNISIIGESMEGVVIKNRPVKEGIAITATLLNTGTNNYLQDLTLDCIAPYGTGDDTKSAERGVCLQDKGNQTICKYVYLKGLQDSYYSNNNSGTFYFEDGRIEGTVDYVCGNGDVYFNAVMFYNTTRSQGGGNDVIAAPNTPKSFGYIFNKCTIDGTDVNNNNFRLGRPWAETGSSVRMLDTKMLILPVAEGWSEWGTHTVVQYGEYNSVDANDNAIDLSGRRTTFGASTSNPVITAEQAANYRPEAIFAGEWKPFNIAAQVEAPEATYDAGNVTWTPANNGATAYLIEKNGEFAGITTGNNFAITINTEKDNLTIRAANSRGGFGEAKQVEGTATGIHAAKAATERGEQVIYNLAGQRVSKATQGLYIVNGQKVILK